MPRSELGLDEHQDFSSKKVSFAQLEQGYQSRPIRDIFGELAWNSAASAYVDAQRLIPSIGALVRGYDDGRAQVIQGALSFINFNALNCELTIDDVARDANVSARHLNRLLASRGTTIGACIAERRMEEAERLLRETDSPVSEVALLSGFSSAAHFTRGFSRQRGISPSAFRSELSR